MMDQYQLTNQIADKLLSALSWFCFFFLAFTKIISVADGKTNLRNEH